MTINKEINGSELKLALEGRLDTVTSSELSAVLDETLAAADSVIFDFAKLDYVSSSGLRVLLSTQKTLNTKSGKMHIINVSDDLMEIFEVTGLSDVFTIN